MTAGDANGAVERVGSRGVTILLVEDNPGDVELAREGLLEGKIANELFVVGNGDDALRFLRNEGEHAGAPRPGLVLLDLNLPGKDGREVLKEIKEDPRLKSIPVVVLTTSAADADILSAYDNHVNAYMTKPVSFEKFVHLIQELTNYWFEVVCLPPT